MAFLVLRVAFLAFFAFFFVAMCSLLERSNGWTIETHGRLARAERKRKEPEPFSRVHSEPIALARLLAP